MNSGVYAITNLANGYQYIGSSKNIKKRWAVHLRELNSGIHGNVHLQSAWNLYGEDGFEFTIVEECGVEFLLEQEQFLMDTVKPEYNICMVAGSPQQTEISAETRAKLSATAKQNWYTSPQRSKIIAKLIGNTYALGYKHSAETCAKESVAHKGCKHSPETRAKMSIVQTGHKCSAETRAKISAAHMGKTVAPETRTKIAIAMKGNTHGLGYKHTLEAREKISVAVKERRRVY